MTLSHIKRLHGVDPRSTLHHKICVSSSWYVDIFVYNLLDTNKNSIKLNWLQSNQKVDVWKTNDTPLECWSFHMPVSPCDFRYIGFNQPLPTFL